MYASYANTNKIHKLLLFKELIRTHFESVLQVTDKQQRLQQRCCLSNIP